MGVNVKCAAIGVSAETSSAALRISQLPVSLRVAGTVQPLQAISDSDWVILAIHLDTETTMAENPMTDRQFKILKGIMKPFSRLNVFVYKLTGGRVMGTLTGRPVMLVTMKGAKSGKTRTTPLMYVPYKDGVIVVASLGGAPKSPVWYNNLVVNPDITVQYKNNKMNLRARQVDDAEKAAVWPICVEHYHEYEDYQKRTDRNIPVFVCEPR
tara:strand:- start:4412 stop:5044 length:633 start_codon:yes stop_codon:yes gene_type:complete